MWRARTRTKWESPHVLLSLGRLDRGPHARGRERLVDVLDPERRERVADRVHEAGRRPDRAGLAAALDAQRVHGGRGDRVVELEVRHLAGPGHGVVHHGPGDELA